MTIALIVNNTKPTMGKDAPTSQYIVAYASPAGAAKPQTIEAVSKKGPRALTAPWVQ